MKRKRARAEPRQPPGDLSLVLEFLNSLDAATGQDSWTDPAALGRWLEQRELMGEPKTLDTADLRRAVEARRVLRALLLANTGGGLDEKTIAALDRLALEASCRVRFGESGKARLERRSESLEGVLGRLFGLVLLAQNGEDWPRYKICANPYCRKAYFDGSNRQLGQCCTQKCSNNLSARHYRRKYKARRGRMPMGGRFP